MELENGNVQYENNDAEILLSQMLAEASDDVVEGRVSSIEDTFKDIRITLLKDIR